MGSIDLFGLSWDRPEAWWALSIPALILFAAKRPLRPQVMATGALGLWRRVIETREAAEGERPKVPPGLWWLCAGLTAAVLAMAGPRAREVGASRAWTVLVDRSPGSYLPVDPPGEETRLGSGVSLLELEWRELVHEGDVVRWFDGTEWAESDRFPHSWRAAPRDPMRAPDWARWDSPGSVWLCARTPPIERSVAYLCASGGRAAPGPVAIDRGDRLDWAEDGITRVAGGAPIRSVCLVDVRGELVDFVELWAEERGLVLRRGVPTPDDVLVISMAGGQAEGGDLSRGAQGGVISLSPGEGTAAGADPAEFALFWSERLDAACLPAAGLSPVTARAPIGNAIWLQGVPPDEGRDSGPPGRAWEGWFALLSCGLVAVALVGYPR